MKHQSFSIRARIKSFRFAGQGISAFLRSEHNAWIHAVAAIGVVILAVVTGLSKHEWLALVLVIALVWITEMINTCIERMMDYMTTERKPEVKFIKDVAAGAVLVAAIAALMTGCLLFIPKLWP
ncbi:diacylglycerol kinase [Paraflavitalea pollutisoli]|uniref:diacylglycerol kinase n=1 Tax=Paraflavitalea pollutisoli TaxID=3034143 RepID=UPI0023EB1EC6|nr:diacylglycerol kinase family protein [Paraflavitalea sp. H1-2-19X]